MKNIFENKVVDCKEFSNIILDETKHIIDSLDKKTVLKIYQVGDNKESNVYVKNKIKKCEKVGIQTKLVKIDHYEGKVGGLVYGLMDKIGNDNSNSNIDSVMVQLPLPKGIEKEQVNKIINMIGMSKDVDGLSKLSMIECGYFNNYEYLPCTSLGILALIRKWMEYKKMDDLSGITVAMYGRSDLVNKPLYGFLDKLNATITVYHSKSYHDYNPEADIVISALPIPKVFRNVNCQLFIDVTTVNVDGKLCGSLDTSNVNGVSHYTSVPGGVGQLTTAMLCYKVALAGSRGKRFGK